MVATTFIRAGALASFAFHITQAAETVQQSSDTCDTVCQHIHDPSAIGSIGGIIGDSVASGTNTDITKGKRTDSCAGFHDASAIWNIWSKSFEVSYPNSVSHIGDSGSLDDRVCIDKVALARLTAAASACHSVTHGSGSGSSSWSWSQNTSTGSMHFPGGGDSSSGGGDLHVQPGDGGNSGAHDLVGRYKLPDGGAGGDAGGGAGGGAGGAGAGGSASGGGFDSSAGGAGFGSGGVSGGGSSSNIATGGGGSSSFSSGGGSGTTSSSGWGHGNVHTESICFRIKDKKSERYLTSGGVEYAYAYYPNYYSIFRAYPTKSVAGGYTLTEINRNGGTVNYPVMLNTGLGQFKPKYGDKEAIFTFSPTNFGDSCWGVPGRKMSRRHDWGSWGDNYRQVTSGGEECADIELEEADC